MRDNILSKTFNKMFKYQTPDDYKMGDRILLVTVILLSIFGAIMVFSATYYYDASGEDPNALASFLKQLLGVGGGILVMFFLSYFNYRNWDSIKIFLTLFLVSAFLLILTLVIGSVVSGATRWFKIMGVSVQSSEVARFTILLGCASWFSRSQEKLMSRDKKVVLNALKSPALIIGILIGLIAAGRSLSMVLTAIALVGVMMYVAGTRNWVIVSLMALGGIIIYIGVTYTDFRAARMAVYLDPWIDPKDTGYQIIQGIYALANGGIFGVGLGDSLQKIRLLPEADTDFILAVIGEELGFVGIMGVVFTFIVIMWRGTLIAQRAPTRYGMLLAYGVVAIIMIQCIINIGVVSKMLPATGLPLPFVSRGLSSLLIFFAEVGLLLNISKHSRRT